MSKILANEIANYGDDSPIDLKEGLNVPAGKPIQAAGSSGTSGQVLSTTGTTIQWVTPFTGSYTDLTNKPTIPAAQVNADWNASSGLGVILNKPVVPAQPSVTTASAGTASLAYNTANGEFTFTPPDLSSFATETYVTTRGYLTSYTETDPIFSASAASNITTTKISNWDTAYGWGNHSTAGYLIAESDTLQTVIGRGNTSTSPAYFTSKLYYQNNFATADLTVSLAAQYPGMFTTDQTSAKAYASFNNEWNEILTWYSSINDLNDVDTTTVAPQNGQVLKWDSTLSKWKPANDLTGGGGGGLSLSDLSVQSATPSGGGSLVYNDGSGVFTYTPPDLSSYITSLGDAIRDADFTTNGIMKRSGAGVYTSITDNTANWDTAFGWGNHAVQGYLTQLPVHGLGVHTGVTLTNETAGDLLQYSGTQWVNWTPNYATETWVGTQGFLTAADQPYDSIAEGEAKVETIRTTGSPAAGDTADEITFTVGWNDADGTNSTNEVGHIDSHGRWFIGPYSGGSATHPDALTDGTSLIISKSFDRSNNISGTTYNYACLHLNNPSPQGQSALGKIYFSGYGNAFEGGSIIGIPTGSWGNFPNYRATDITINLNGYGVNGSVDQSLVERWRFKASGALAVNGIANTGSAGQVLTSQGDASPTWETPSGGGGGASVTISDTPPAASAGDLWWESDTGRLKIYYQDTDTIQWVDVNAPLRQDRIASTGAPSAASDTGVAGDIRYDSGYVYIAVATNTWKRAALTTW